MADTKNSALTEATTLANDDLFNVVDVSDTTMAATGTNKKITKANLKTTLDVADASHTHTASQITDFDTEVSNNTDVAANTAARNNATKIQNVNIDASVGTPSDGDILVYRSAGSDFVLEAKPTSSGSPAWGGITGTLASQTDLQSALNAKLANVVEDTTPQLGGNLDLNTFNVGAATAADLTKLNALTATSTELNYVDGVTSAIQTQINGKQDSGATLTSLEGLSLVAGDMVYATAADTLTRLAKGTASQVLTMNAGATAPEWAAAGGGGGSSVVYATAAEILPNFVMNTGGWNSYTNGAGATLGAVAGEGYLRMQSSSSFTADTLAAYQKNDYSFIDTTYNIFDKDMRITAILKSIQATNSPSESFFGTVDIVMDNAADIPFTKTVKHIGIYRTTGSGSSTYTASNANGTTQTSTTFTGPTNEKFASWRIDYVAGTSIKYYLNGTLMATHTTNLPTGAQTTTGTSLCVAIGNTGAQIGAAPELYLMSAKLEVEA